MAQQGSSNVSLTAGKAVVSIDPGNGGRLTSLRIGALELLRQGPRYGAFPMVPWCGRLDSGRFSVGGQQYQLPINSAPHAIHGTGRDSVWRVEQADGISAALAYDLTDPWPFPGRVTQRIALTENALTLTMGIEAADASFPAQVGWHPWFLRNLGVGEDVRLEFTAAWQEERGDSYLPTGRRIPPRPGPWDDCFGMPNGVDVTLTWPGALELRVTSPAEWVTVFDQKPEAACVEPQSGPPNGVNTLPRLVTPTEPLVESTTWSWLPLD